MAFNVSARAMWLPLLSGTAAPPGSACSPEDDLSSHTNIRRWNSTTTNGVAVRFTVCGGQAARVSSSQLLALQV